MNVNHVGKSRLAFQLSALLAAMVVAYPIIITRVSADSVGPDGVVFVSLIRLIAHPEQYDGKRIQVRGYYVRGFEESGLYPTVEDYEIGNLPNGIWISTRGIKGDEIDKLKEFRGHVAVIGTFRHDPSTKMVWQSQIKDVTELNIAPNAKKK